MGPPSFHWRYDRAETVADGVVHGVGLIFGLIGAATLACQASHLPRIIEAASACIYLVALLAMLGFSAAYNLWPVSPIKWRLRRFDHAAIYLLIAGTYTPFAARLEGSSVGPTVLALVWLTALVGIGLKLFLPGRFDRLSILLYLLLSWSGIVAYEPIFAAVPSSSLRLLFTGGLTYSAGVVFHLWERLRFHNAIWHGFVMLGAAQHYFAVLVLVNASLT